MTANVLTAPLRDDIDTFLRHLESLAEALPMSMMLLQYAGKDADKAFADFAQLHVTTAEDADGSTRHTVPVEHYRQWKRLHRRSDRISVARVLVPRSMFVSLVSEFDAFIGRLLKTIFLLRPELLNGSDRSLTYAEVCAFPSMDDVRNHIIEKEVEVVLRMSHAEQFKWLQGRFGLPLTKELPIWPQFIELTERRNLFVHTDGRVSSQYLKVCNEHSAKLEPNTALGATLGVSQQYYEESHNCIFELGFKLAHVLWRKLFPTDRALADDSLIAAGYELLVRREFRLAQAVFDFACDTIKTHCDERTRLICTVNRAQAYRWQGDGVRCREILAQVDWSAKSDEFKLAAFVLREDWDEAVACMHRIGRHGVVKKHNYADWPLFKQFRDRPEFRTAYEVIYGDPYTATVVATADEVEQHADDDLEQTEKGRPN